jgi:2-oxoglutarate ferredoxin oxidoreductase subunit beta
LLQYRHGALDSRPALQHGHDRLDARQRHLRPDQEPGVAHLAPGPEEQHDAIAEAFHHKGLSFVRVLQRCPEYLEHRYDEWVQDPDRMLLLSHSDGVQVSSGLASVYRNIEEHDPADRNRAREVASSGDPIPVGVLYRNPEMPCYEDLQAPDRLYPPDVARSALETELDKFTIQPSG